MSFIAYAFAMAGLITNVMAQGAAPPAATGAAAVAAALAEMQASEANVMFWHYILTLCGALIAAMIIWRVVHVSVVYVRTLACLNNDKQRYFSIPSQTYSSIKKNLLYAPVFGQRHNREFRLSGAMNMGTLPTRLQLLFLASIFGTNIAFCVVSIHWDLEMEDVAQELRNRTGILAVVNMVCQGHSKWKAALTMIDPTVHHGCA